MTILGPFGFVAPWLLLGLLALPVLWVLLRAVPPAPLRRRFPGVALLMGLRDDDAQRARTPWWVLVLRTLGLGLLILGFAGPVLNPRTSEGPSGDLLLVFDASWASAPGWQDSLTEAASLIDAAQITGDRVALVRRSDPAAELLWQNPVQAARGLSGLVPLPWGPQADSWAAALDADMGALRTVWFSDGLADESRARVLQRLQARGSVEVIERTAPVVAMRALRPDGRALVLRAEATRPVTAKHEARFIGRDPAGMSRVLATVALEFSGGTRAEASVTLPPELRNRLSRVELSGVSGAMVSGAGAVQVLGDRLHRREVALIAGRESREGIELLAPLHYLRNALAPSVDLMDGTLLDVLQANPDVIILADVAALADLEAQKLQAWIADGGLLLRFAGPRMAAAQTAQDAGVLPVQLRQGGRSLGGAMSWETPKRLAPFPQGSPFFGLTIPDDVTVSAQVLAEPDPQLADRVIARLEDGTPLATRRQIGDGQVILIHVTANAEWSTLPLSGLFVQMLDRLMLSAAGAQTEAEPAGLEGTTWKATALLDAFGRLSPAEQSRGVPGARLAKSQPGPDLPPGLYEGPGQRRGVNVITPQSQIASARWPSDVPVRGLTQRPARSFGGWLLGAGLLLLLGDVIATLALSGRVRRGAVVVLPLLFVFAATSSVEAQESPLQGDPSARSEIALAHVLTGDEALDEIAHAGLRGLSNALFLRSSVEPSAPVGVNLDRDELAFYPLLYWPITPEQPLPSAQAYAKLNRYLRGGGMIVFDTRDADLAGIGSGTPEARRLRELAAPLDLPPLEQVPSDHVLTRSFYLLQEFPGRHPGAELWVEATAPGLSDSAPVAGQIRTLNDGVTPVVIGGNDWAAAWAVDAQGNRLLPVGRGTAGERQREMAYRFGVNLVMHVLTGNYKSDQVHVPALLDRLGQ